MAGLHSLTFLSAIRASRGEGIEQMKSLVYKVTSRFKRHLAYCIRYALLSINCVLYLACLFIKVFSICCFLNTQRIFAFINCIGEILDRTSFMMHTSIIDTVKIFNFCFNVKKFKLLLLKTSCRSVKSIKQYVFPSITF